MRSSIAKMLGAASKTPLQKMKEPQQVQLVIIGAGAAGIAAGCRLLENHFNDFVILEASNRIGGRLHTIPFRNGSLDLGAEWVHGEKGNPVFEMASKLDLLYHSSSPFEKSMSFQSTGKAFPLETSLKLMECIDEIIDSCDPAEVVAYKGSMGSYFTEKYWPMVTPLINEGKLTTSEAEDALIWLEHVENSIDGSPSWYQTSMDEAIEYVKLPGNVLIAWKQGGYSTILDILTKKIPNPAERLDIESKIRLGVEVTLVDWSGPRVLVGCADGSQYSSEKVLTTVSLNVLKAEANKIFSPMLPLKNLNAIQGLGMGTVDKIFLEFPYRWWPSGGVNLMWRKEDAAQVPKELYWTTGVFGFYTEDNHPLNVLCGWVVGPYAEAMEEASDQEVMRECMKLLRRFVGKTFEIPDAISMHRSKWFTNPYVRGSYSCRMVTSNAKDVWPKDLAKPVVNSSGKQVLLFAGEATHDHLFSTVHGAIETGWREADRILSLQTRGEHRTVAIVGAGIAGLAAANTLASAGVDVVVLEAQSTPGGRIHSVATDCGFIELGAQWLHGENSEVHKLAESRGLLSGKLSSEGMGRYCRPDGSVVPYNLVDEVHCNVMEILRNCEKYVNSTKYPASVGAELENHFKEFRRSSLHAENSGQIIDELFKWHERFQLIDNACSDLRKLSAKAWGLFRECGENHCINFKNGFSSLIETMVKSLPEGTVLLNTPVRTIEWLPESTAGPRFAHVKVICDNMELMANHVIVTSSLGYLKENKERMFSPSLPIRLSKAIDDVGFGSIAKLFLIYDKPWWSENEKGFQFIWLDNPSLTKSTPWAEGVTGFDVLPDKPVLLGWVGGTSANLVETIPEEKLKKQATELLRRFTANQDIPQPKLLLRSMWHTNEFVRGAYSHIPSTCDQKNVTNSALTEPVFTKFHKGTVNQAPTILLAGEACSKHYYSTVHGAYDSGQQQANVVIDFLKKAKSAKL